MRLIYTLGFSFLALLLLGQKVEGVILDDHGQPMIGAEVLLLPDSSWTVTDENGDFSLHISSIPFRIEAYYIGYQVFRRDFQTIPSKKIQVELQPKEALLDVVHVSEEHAKQELSLPALHLDEEYFESKSRSSFAMMLDRLPGLSAINVGTGIAKPVIRGLYGNRILVNDLGIKQEGQQWGNDHGLEIDPFNAERVEIIKGPASLQYGSDAMGGVINIMQKKIPATNSVSGGAIFMGKSNDNYLGASMNLNANYRDFFMHARYTQNSFGDFQVPARSFTYNGIVLPIFDNTVKNTAGNNNNVHLTLGYRSERSITKITYSRFDFKGGFFSGAVGIPRSYTLQPDGDGRNIDVPFQSVLHEKWILNQTFHFGENHWVINMGYQQNQREEHSFPDYHSVRASELEEGETLGLGFDLKTLSMNTHYEYRPTEEWKHIIGGNIQRQDHSREGFEYLLPDYHTFRSGLYSISEWEVHPAWHLNGGLRLDFAQNNSSSYTQYVYNRGETITDSLQSPATDDDFFNYAWAIGLSHDLSPSWITKLNLARSFRIPYPNETVSNGVHHGTFRHEQGNPGLQTETGYQADLNFQYTAINRSKLNLSLFANYFQDYIYLRPSASFSRLPEAGQLFQYVQDNAFFTGMELSWDQAIGSHFQYELNAEGLYSINLEESTPLPFTPPASLHHTFSYQLEGNGSFKNATFSLQHEYTAAQNRVDRNEARTPAYHLFGVQAHSTFSWAGVELRMDLEVQNLFDTAYLRHLSRYRLLNLPEQGRNVVLRLGLSF